MVCAIQASDLSDPGARILSERMVCKPIDASAQKLIEVRYCLIRYTAFDLLQVIAQLAAYKRIDVFRAME